MSTPSVEEFAKLTRDLTTAVANLGRAFKGMATETLLANTLILPPGRWEVWQKAVLDASYRRQPGTSQLAKPGTRKKRGGGHRRPRTRRP